MTATVGTEEFAANLGLGHLGQPEIASMSDTTTRARKVRQFFPVARQATLRLKPWNFATGWVQPAQDPVQSLGHLKLRFPMPAECLRVRFIKGDNQREWDVESGAASVGGVDVEVIILVTNITDPTVCYTKDVRTPRLWDSLFLDAFGFMLASYLAESLGRSRELGEQMRQRAEGAVSGAATIDAKERRQQCRPETSWEAARRGRGFSGRRLW
ncbi:hypothetical protein IVB40_07630 [Bradyrhizobium sp. 40]|uniref:hypothetical protein n=1 Tax=Bradyrhizobium sp. 40 TaxID=2782674 RepID=UPI001FFFB589|nr:hypothetical protein [Bradyrhizobium sp. 40]UPJ43931.1 hypothetical protein IVB40_07630 [Bradyrhizobium sp. 40]